MPRATIPLPADPAEAKSSGERLTMEVALLACRPRFDVDAEHWYFDLHIDPSLVPEAFVRLGLVRYQANAPKALRVSEPVVEWAQLLPKRVVAVPPVGRRVKVRVVGAGSPLPIGTGGAAGSEDRVPGILRHGPLMKVTVYRRSKDGIETVAALAAPEAGERATRERVALTPTQPTLGIAIIVGRSGYPLSSPTRFVVTLVAHDDAPPDQPVLIHDRSRAC